MLRTREHFGSKCLVVGDSLTVTQAIAKGRSSSYHLLHLQRKMAALTPSTNTLLSVRWVASELNAADGPSRGSWRATIPLACLRNHLQRRRRSATPPVFPGPRGTGDSCSSSINPMTHNIRGPTKKQRHANSEGLCTASHTRSPLLPGPRGSRDQPRARPQKRAVDRSRGRPPELQVTFPTTRARLGNNPSSAARRRREDIWSLQIPAALIFIEVFSGSGRLAKAIAAEGWQVMC